MQRSFDSVPWSFMRTYIMMIGEFDFTDLFTEHDDHSAKLDSVENLESARNVPFPLVSTVLFCTFVFLGAIIIMNLTVGLAVDDIQSIQENAALEKLTMRVGIISICH